jgi:hypothetical protein
MKNMFVDQIGNAALVGGVFKLELLQSTSLEGDRARSEFEPIMRVNMSVDSMLRLHQTLEQAVAEMKNKNLIKPRQSPEETGTH